MCVGKDGWLNERAHAVIARNPNLKKKITFITKVDDGELRTLYDASLFTIYPSHYEGWGLPITESLSFGRVPLYADNSSLTEAGAGFGVAFESNNLDDLIMKAERLIDDTPYRTQLESDIARDYQPITWAKMASEIIRFSNNVESCAFFPRPEKQNILGKYIPLRLNRSMTIWNGIGSGEIYRHGDGWLWPDERLCRIRPGTALLSIRGIIPCGIARVFLHLKGLISKGADFVIRSAGTIVASGRIDPEMSMWSVFEVAPQDNSIHISIESHDSEVISVNYGGSQKVLAAGIGVFGFTISNSENPDDRLTFLETVMEGNVERSSLYKRL